MKRIPYSHQTIDREDVRAIVDVLKSDWVTQGPMVEAFEKALCRYTGARYAVTVSSGTAALHIACLAAGIKEGDEVITSPITFVASANSVLYCGGRPVFADIQEETANIDPDKIAGNISRKTKAIIPVHFAGHPADLGNIRRIARANDLFVIEDAAHALGARYKGSAIGSCRYSDMAIFSFHPVKSITTGEGGAVLTNNRELYERLLILRNHGITKDASRLRFKNRRQNSGPWYYEQQSLGFNYRITDIQCALGISQMKKLDTFIERRREIARHYQNIFARNPFFEFPHEKEGVTSSWHLFSIRLKDHYKTRREEIFTRLKRTLGLQVHYIPVYLQPYYRKMGYRKGLCPNAEDFYEREISIPLYASMTKKDVRYVTDTLLNLEQNLRRDNG